MGKDATVAHALQASKTHRADSSAAAQYERYHYFGACHMHCTLRVLYWLRGISLTNRGPINDLPAMQWRKDWCAGPESPA